jgi:hypothetical protein
MNTQDTERGASIIHLALQLMKERRIGWSEAIELARQQTK